VQLILLVSRQGIRFRVGGVELLGCVSMDFADCYLSGVWRFSSVLFQLICNSAAALSHVRPRSASSPFAHRTGRIGPSAKSALSVLRHFTPGDQLLLHLSRSILNQIPQKLEV
jgi:hypothetical protein